MRMMITVCFWLLCVGQVFAGDSSVPASEVPVGSITDTGNKVQKYPETPQPARAGKAKDSNFYGGTAAEPPKKGKAASGQKDKKGSQVDSGSDEVDVDKKEAPLPQASQDGVGEQSVMPEIMMKAMLSASDVNRIVCGTEIKDVTFSKEKGVMVKYSGKNAFVKFAVTKLGDKTLYAVNPVEMFIVCGENVYNIIAIPKRIPSQTIRLNSGKIEKIQKNNTLHAGQSFERKLLEIIKYSYTDDLPDSYSITQRSEEIKAFRDAIVMHKRDIVVEGEGLIVHEYYVTLGGAVEQLSITEKDFLKKVFASRAVAIGADKLNLRKGDVARVFVVDAKEADNVEKP